MNFSMVIALLLIMPPATVRLSQTISEPVIVSAGWQQGWLVVFVDRQILRLRPEITEDGTAILHQSTKPTTSYYTMLSVEPDGERLLTKGHSSEPTSVFSANMELICSIGGGAYKPESIRQLISGDGSRVLQARRSFNSDRKELWDLHLVDLTTKLTQTLTLDSGSHNVVGMGLSPDDKLAVLSHHQGRIDFVSLPELKLIRQIDSGDNLCTTIKFTRDGRYVGLLNLSDLVIFDCESGKESAKWSANATDEDRHYLYSFDFSPDGEFVYVGFADFPANKTFHISRLSMATLSTLAHALPLKGISHSPTFDLDSVHASPDGQWIATVATTSGSTEISFSHPEAFENYLRFPSPTDAVDAPQ